MAIIYSYTLSAPKVEDIILGTVTYDENADTPVYGNPTVNFSVQSIINMVADNVGAQNLQQVTNIGAITTNAITFSNDISVAGKFIDSAGQPGTAGQTLSSTAVGTSWINAVATGVTTVATTDGTFIDLTPNAATAGAVTVTADLSASGTKDGTTFLRGDNQWAVPPGTAYILPVATDGALGGIQIGYVENGKNYPIELTAEKAFVNVPWTDVPYVLPVATVADLGGVRLFNATVNDVTPETIVPTAGRNYAIELSTAEKMIVNVPWEDNPYYQNITGTGSNNTDSGVLLSNTGGTVLIIGDGTVINAAQTGNTITLTGINTWIANAVTVAGYVAAPAAVDANLVWKTNGSGEPAWRADADTGFDGLTLDVNSAGTWTVPLGQSTVGRQLTIISNVYGGGAKVGYVPDSGTSTTYLKGDGTWGAIPTGLIFKGTWDASGGGGGNPDLTALTPAEGWLYICDNAGTAYPNGGVLAPSVWALGDWCIYDGSAWTLVPATNAGVTSVTTTDGTFIDLTPNAATTGAVTVTSDLSATNLSGTPAGKLTQFLRGDNTWQVPDYIPDTTYQAGTGLSLDTTTTPDTFNVRVNTTASAVPEGLSTTASQTYKVQLDDQSENLVVNVPWGDNPYYQTITGTGTDNTDSGVLLSDSGGTVLVLGAGSVTAAQSGNTITLTGVNTTYDLEGIGSDNTDSGIRLNPSTGTNDDILILGAGSTSVSRTGSTITITSAAGSYNWVVRDSAAADKTLSNAEFLSFASATGALGTAVTGTGTTLDPYLMTISSPDTTYSAMGAGNSYAVGLVLAGAAADGGNFLRKDGTWQVPPDTQGVTSITAGIGLDTSTGSPITGAGTMIVDYGPGTGNVITFSNAGVAGGTIDKTEDYFMWSDTDDSKTVKHSLIQDLPFASSSASGTVTGITGGDGIIASASNTIPSVSVDYTASAANVIDSALISAITVPTTDYMLILKSTGSAVGTVERTLISKLPFGTGTVTSVGYSHAGNAFTVGGSPVTSSGTLAVTMAGASTDYIDGAGNLTVFPAIPQGDITGVTAGTGMTGGGTSGAVTLNVIGGTGITANADDIAIDSTVATLAGTQTFTNKSGNISMWTNDSGYITDAGVTSIVAGTNVTISPVGGTGAVTVNSTDQYVGTITSVTGTAPVVSSGGTTPAISMAVASASANGYLSSTNWSTFNNKVGGSGTANYVSKWSSGSAQTNSVLRDNGTGLSVGAGADANYKMYINAQYGFKSIVSVNAGIGFYADATGITTSQLFKGDGLLQNGGTGTVFEVTRAGVLTVTGDIIAYGTPSDKRLKENIKPIESALDKVEKLKGVTFDWKEQDKDIKQTWVKDIGFIAQDVQEVLPELVRENPDGMLSMRHQGITPILVEAIKELKAEIEELKNKQCNCKCN